MELVHVHHPFLSGRLALRYCRPLRIPIVFTNHTRYDLYAQAYLPLLPEEISDTLLQTYLPHFCAAVDLVISPSPGMADVLRRLGVTAPIEIVPNGVRLDAFHQAGRGLRAELGFQESDILSIYVGRLEREKSLEFLLRAFCGVAEAVENAHLLIVGSGTEEAVLKEQAAASPAADRIHFAGMLVYDLLPAYLAMCDLFVTASVTEVHPLSVIEAMASGLPVLGIQSVGVGDTVEDGTTGFLSSNSEAAFAARLARLCLDPDLRSRMGTAAREAAKKYDVERTTEIVLSHYRRLISAATSPKRGLRVRLRGLLERMRG
jgi:glycosyltransferase involved in cell wall biosynthesis